MTYSKYIIKTIFPTLIIITVVLTAIVWINQLMRLLYLLDKGINILDFLGIVLLVIPSLLFSVMPIITLLAILTVYNKLREERQLIVLKNSGLNDFSIARPALIVAAIVSIFSFFLSAYLMPLSYNSLKEKVSILRNSYISNVIDTRKFNQISKSHTIYVDQKDSKGTLEGIILFDNTTKNSRSVLFAKYGNVYMEKDEMHFELSNGLRQAYDNNNNITRMHFNNLSVRIANDPQDESKRIKKTHELYIWELLFPTAESNEEKRIRLIAEGHSRIIWPLFNLIFTILTLGFFLKIGFSRKFRWQPIFLCIVPALLITFIHFTLQKYSYSNLDVIYFSYANLLLCIIFSIWQLKRKVM